MAGKKKRKLNKNAYIAGAAVGAVVLIGVIALVVRAATGSSKNETGSNVSISGAGDIVNSQFETQAVTWAASRVDTTVEIQMDDFSAVVGTQIKVVALVTPANTEQSVVWNSSNTEVFTVTNEGVVVITGTGKAVLTATAGTVSDSIIVEGITSMSSGSSSDLPLYTASNSSSGYSSGNSYTGGGSSGGGSSDGGSDASNVSGDGEDGTEAVNGGEDENQEQASEGQGDAATNSDGEENKSDEDTTQILDGNQYNTNLNPTGGNGGYDSTNVGEILPDNGFDPVMSNVYTYEENGTYYGEIVTQPNVTIIYIKQRSDDFDAKVQSVIASMIPENASQVWNTYLTANTDKTFVVDNKKVRVVVPESGGHSQIVIYN